MARLFFALWPDRWAREALALQAARLAKLTRGRAVPAPNLHLTLVFLGDVDSAGSAAARRAADTVEAVPFMLALDEAGSFGNSGVGWAGCRQPPRELMSLQSGLEAALQSGGFPPESRPYSPHLTLVRGIMTTVRREPIAPVSWEATAFSLVESRRDRGGYATLAAWPLGTGNR